jgi:hypothetical protein
MSLKISSEWQSTRAHRKLFNFFKQLRNRLITRKARISCRNHPLSALRSDTEAKDGVSVEKANDTWCRDNNGEELGSDGLYRRWGITQLDVPNRSSFWLRAAKTCDTTEKFNRWECVRALNDGLEKRDNGQETHGLAASIACLDYSIDLSGVTYNDMSPWAEEEESRRFLPSEFAEKKDGGGKSNVPVCDKGDGARPLTDDDLNTAI